MVCQFCWAFQKSALGFADCSLFFKILYLHLFSSLLFLSFLFFLFFFLYSLGLICSSFPYSLRCKFRFWFEIFLFLIGVFTAINFSYSTAFVHTVSLVYVILICICLHILFLCGFWKSFICFGCAGSSLLCSLFSSCGLWGLL